MLVKVTADDGTVGYGDVVLPLHELNEVQREAVVKLRGEYTRAILEKEELASLVKDLERQQAEE